MYFWDPDIKQKNPRGHEYQTREYVTLENMI
jgi:hypothetical protein